MKMSDQLGRVGAVLGVAVLASLANGAVDNVRAVFNGNKVPGQLDPPAVAGRAYGTISAFDYDPVNSVLYLSTNGASPGGQILKFADLNNPIGTVLVGTTQWSNFDSGKQPAAFGMALNPVTWNGNLPYTVVAFADAHPISGGVLTTADAKRVYAYDLQQLEPTSPTAHIGHMSPLITAASMNTAAGLPSSTNVHGGIRSPRFGHDGRSVYVQTSQSGTGGVFRYDATANAVTRISSVTNTADIAVHKASNSVDRIYFSDASNNVLSIDYDHVNNTYTTATTLIPADDMYSLLGIGSQMSMIQSISVDAAGKVYVFYARAGANRSVVVRYDVDGTTERLAKIATLNEISTVRAGHSITARHTTVVGDELWFSNGSADTPWITALKLYEPGDFNRDGSVDGDDAALLRQPGVINALGGTTNVESELKFDLNGDVNSSAGAAILAVVDNKDVQKFQEFFDFPDGDTNFDTLLNLDDLTTMNGHYGAAGVWTDGNFSTDNDTVTYDDLALLASTWLDLGLPKPTLAQISGFDEGFRADVITAFAIPEPASIGALAVVGMLLGRRQRKA